MSGAAALLLVAAPTAASVPTAEVANEIVVIGRKLEKTWRGTLAKTDGQLACRTTRSTGDRAIDAIGCETMVTCTRAIEPQMDALAAADLRKSERRRRMQALMQTTVPCMTGHRQEAIARLAVSRAGS